MKEKQHNSDNVKKVNRLAHTSLHENNIIKHNKKSTVNIKLKKTTDGRFSGKSNLSLKKKQNKQYFPFDCTF